MPKVTFLIDGEPQTVEFISGALPYSHHGKPESFLDVAKHFHLPLEHACGGSCACTTCHIIVKDGNITLEGVVANEGDKNIAGIQANSVQGAFGVTNNLRVEGSANQEDTRSRSK